MKGKQLELLLLAYNLAMERLGEIEEIASKLTDGDPNWTNIDWNAQMREIKRLSIID